MLKIIFTVVSVICMFASSSMAGDMEITPFRMVNQSPLVQIFGMPSETAATVSPKGYTRISLTQDLANNYTVGSTNRELILLDGESWRWTLAARYGLSDHFEAGIELPYILTGGGFLDSFIVDWHRTFGMPQGGRDAMPKDTLLYYYRKDGVTKLNMGRSGSGIGDISLTTAMKLYDQLDSSFHDSIALRAALKLPTGDSAALRGSGSTDFSLYLCGSMNKFTEWGSLALFGSAGGMTMSGGDVLRDQQRNLAGFGTAGLGWGPAEWISLKFQLNAHTAIYRNSSLNQLSKNTLMLIMGGALKLPDSYNLDIGISEDVVITTSPDVTFHLGLSKQF